MGRALRYTVSPEHLPGVGPVRLPPSRPGALQGAAWKTTPSQVKLPRSLRHLEPLWIVCGCRRDSWYFIGALRGLPTFRGDMYGRVCIYVCVCIYVYMYTYIHTYVHSTSACINKIYRGLRRVRCDSLLKLLEICACLLKLPKILNGQRLIQNIRPSTLSSRVCAC